MVIQRPQYKPHLVLPQVLLEVSAGPLQETTNRLEFVVKDCTNIVKSHNAGRASTRERVVCNLGGKLAVKGAGARQGATRWFSQLVHVENAAGLPA